MIPTNHYQIAFLDIETFPILGYSWRTYDTNLIKVVRRPTMAAYAVKWMGEKHIECNILPDFKAYEKNVFDDSELVHKLWGVFHRADLIIAHNAPFDITWSNARMFLNGERPPSPSRAYDTLKVSRKILGKGMPSHKLDDICEALGIGRKLSHEGFTMWDRCMERDPKAWKTMRRYNTHDITLLEKFYYRVAPWDPTHPNITLDSTEGYLCPVCGSNKTKPDGWRKNKVYSVKKYYCQSCTHYSTGERKKSPVQILS